MSVDCVLQSGVVLESLFLSIINELQPCSYEIMLKYLRRKCHDVYNLLSIGSTKINLYRKDKMLPVDKSYIKNAHMFIYIEILWI